VHATQSLFDRLDHEVYATQSLFERLDHEVYAAQSLFDRLEHEVRAAQSLFGRHQYEVPSAHLELGHSKQDASQPVSLLDPLAQVAQAHGRDIGCLRNDASLDGLHPRGRSGSKWFLPSNKGVKRD
jgi:hypothetical protein